MMNLQLLFKATALPGGKSSWRDIAVAHANTTARVFFRPNGSTYHKVIYDAQTGELQAAGQVRRLVQAAQIPKQAWAARRAER